MKLNILLLLILATFTTPLRAGEPPAGPIVHNAGLSLDGARQAIAAAEACARRNGVGPSIAVVDAGGHLLAFIRSESGFAAGANVSIGKARTAALFKKPTKDFEDLINQGRFTMTALPDFTPLQGGVPIRINGQVVGAIGVSGASSAQQDEEIALAGATSVATRTPPTE